MINSGENYQYQVWESLNQNSFTYIVQKYENKLYKALLAREFWSVFNCRQVEKFRLRVRVKNSLQNREFACVSFGSKIASVTKDKTVKVWDLKKILTINTFDYSCN